MGERVRVAELMDDPAIDGPEHARALRGLSRINRVSGAAEANWRAIEPAAMRHGVLGEPVRMLDIATGSGDVPLGVAKIARARGVKLALTLCDVSETALKHASARAVRLRVGDVETLRADVVRDGLPFEDGSFSIVTCSLFAHHLEADACVGVLREMARVAGHAGTVVVNDLRRCMPGLLAARLAGRTLTTSRIVRVDAVRSVRAAFTIDEMASMAREAGLEKRGPVHIAPVWPWRMMLLWSER